MQPETAMEFAVAKLIDQQTCPEFWVRIRPWTDPHIIRQWARLTDGRKSAAHYYGDGRIRTRAPLPWHQRPGWSEWLRIGGPRKKQLE
jgi:hypothetical protein